MNEEATGPPPGEPPAWAAVRGLGSWKDVSENQDVPGPTLQVRDGEGALFQPSPEADRGAASEHPDMSENPTPLSSQSLRGAEKGGALGSLGPGLGSCSRGCSKVLRV